MTEEKRGRMSGTLAGDFSRVPCPRLSTLAISKLGSSEPVRKNHLHQAGDPVGIKALVADLVLAVSFAGVAAPVGTGAVEVGETVFAGQRPGTEDAATFLFYIGIGG